MQCPSFAIDLRKCRQPEDSGGKVGGGVVVEGGVTLAPYGYGDGVWGRGRGGRERGRARPLQQKRLEKSGSSLPPGEPLVKKD